MYDLYLFDKDQTLSSPFPAWAREAEKALRLLSRARANSRNIPEDIFFDQFIDAYRAKQDATRNSATPFKVTVWYWHLQKLIDAMDILQPQNAAESVSFARQDAEICSRYEKGRKDGVEAFDGVPEMIAALDESGKPLAILSDGRISEIAGAMNKVNISFSHFRAIACQEDEQETDNFALDYQGAAFYYHGKKPDKACVDTAVKLIESFAFEKADIVVIGDNKNDALLVKELRKAFDEEKITITFAWAKYGAALNERAVWFANELLNDAYRLGVEENEKGIRAAGIIPDHILNTPSDVLHIKPPPLIF